MKSKPEQIHLLLGYGERLASEIPPPPGGGPKSHPYTLAQAQQRLTPKIREASRQLAELPEAACPDDRAVALMTLHPSYLAKSYFPGDLLNAYELEAIGSRSREVAPERWTRKKHPETAVTSEIFVAGRRRV